MSLSKLALAAVAAAGILGATGAHAADTQVSEDGHMMFVGPDNRYHDMKLSAAGHKMMMEHAQALPAGAVVYRSGGKIYILQDPKMADEIRQNGTM
jgi:hypothetical protein